MCGNVGLTAVKGVNAILQQMTCQPGAQGADPSQLGADSSICVAYVGVFSIPMRHLSKRIELLRRRCHRTREARVLQQRWETGAVTCGCTGSTSRMSGALLSPPKML